MNSWADFIAMGGYGLYVWGSVGMVVLSLLVEQIGLRVRFRSLMDQITIESEVDSNTEKKVAPNPALTTEPKR